MKSSAKVSGLEKVLNRFGKEIQSFAGGGVVVTGMVGYRAPYAIYVHENLEIDHPIHVDGSGSVRDCHGQAKFLEIPARKMLPNVGRDLAKLKAQKKGLRFSIQTICDRLLRESRKLVPVLTGALYRSGFTKVIIRDRATGRFRR
jgi:hypothetical protein